MFIWSWYVTNEEGQSQLIRRAPFGHMTMSIDSAICKQCQGAREGKIQPYQEEGSKTERGRNDACLQMIDRTRIRWLAPEVGDWGPIVRPVIAVTSRCRGGPMTSDTGREMPSHQTPPYSYCNTNSLAAVYCWGGGLLSQQGTGKHIYTQNLYSIYIYYFFKVVRPRESMQAALMGSYHQHVGLQTQWD